MSLSKIELRVAPLSKRIVLARFGKDPNVALETRDVMSSFWQTLVEYAFDGKLPAIGRGMQIDFGGGDELFVLTIKRVERHETCPPAA